MHESKPNSRGEVQQGIAATIRAVRAAVSSRAKQQPQAARRSAPEPNGRASQPRLGSNTGRSTDEQRQGVPPTRRQARRYAERRSLPASERRRAVETLRVLRQIAPAGTKRPESISDTEAERRRRFGYGIRAAPISGHPDRSAGRRSAAGTPRLAPCCCGKGSGVIGVRLPRAPAALHSQQPGCK